MRRVLPAVLGLVLLLPAGAAADVPAGATFRDAYFPSGDGTLLHADVIRPAGAGEADRTPVILAIGPYFSHVGQTSAAGDDFDPTREGPNERFEDLYTEGRIFERGYTLVQVDLRGFGASNGCNDFGGPGEQADVKAAVEWAASQPWSNGRVGMWGKSYDGWTGVMGLATRPKGLAAAVIMSPIIDGYRTLYMNGVHYDAGWYGTPALYQAIDASPPSIFDSPEYIANSAQGTNPACYAENIAIQNTTRDADTPFWRERELVPRAAGSDVPVLWSHGFTDANTKPDNFMDVWSTLTGPRRAWFGQYDHVRPQDKDDEGNLVVGRKGFIDEAMRWLDRYVKGVPAAEAPVEKDPPVTVEDGGVQRYRSEPAWPPADAARHALPVRSGTHEDFGPLSSGDGTWSISQPLPYDVHLSGVPRLELDVGTDSSRINLFAQLHDIDAQGRRTLITRGASIATGSGKVAWDLYPQDWTLRAGHRLGLLLPPADSEWFEPVPSGDSAEIRGGTLSLPFLRFIRSSFLEGGPTLFERERGEGEQVPADVIAESGVEAQLPPRMVERPAAARKPRARRSAISLSIRRVKGRRLRTSGRAPSGRTVRVRLVRGSRVLQRRTVVARRGRYVVHLRTPRPGRYRVAASVRARDRSVHSVSRSLRVPRR